MKHFLLCLTLLFSVACSAQDLDKLVPADIGLNTSADYEQYETYIIADAAWLEKTPMETDKNIRKKINTFVVKWVTGSPSVSIMMTGKIMKYCNENPDLLLLYIASYSRHVLENKKGFTVESANKAALQSMIKLYEISLGRKKSKSMEKLIKDKDNLDKYAADLSKA